MALCCRAERLVSVEPDGSADWSGPIGLCQGRRTFLTDAGFSPSTTGWPMETAIRSSVAAVAVLWHRVVWAVAAGLVPPGAPRHAIGRDNVMRAPEAARCPAVTRPSSLFSRNRGW